jgi:hypothetical protein
VHGVKPNLGFPAAAQQNWGKIVGKKEMTKKNTLYYLILSEYDSFNFSKDQDFVLQF